jgi:dienelactone hydrolase
MAPACCPPGSWPQLLTTTNADLNKDDVPASKGSLQSIPVPDQEDLTLYVVDPEGDAKGSIVVLPDIYSVRVLTPDVRSGDRIGSICDALAGEGYRVVLAGIFRDKAFDKAVQGPDDGDFLKFNCFEPDGGADWMKSQTYDKIGPSVKAAVAFAKEKGGKVGVLGFCFGTWATCKASAEGDIDIDCAVGCHPTTLLESAVFGRDEDAMMASLKQPTTMLWAGNDSDSYTGEGANKIAIEKSGGKVHEFTDMLHGWVSRGDVADAAVKAGVESAVTIIKETFASM